MKQVVLYLTQCLTLAYLASLGKNTDLTSYKGELTTKEYNTNFPRAITRLEETNDGTEIIGVYQFHTTDGYFTQVNYTSGRNGYFAKTTQIYQKLPTEVLTKSFQYDDQKTATTEDFSDVTAENDEGLSLDTRISSAALASLSGK